MSKAKDLQERLASVLRNWAGYAPGGEQLAALTVACEGLLAAGHAKPVDRLFQFHLHVKGHPDSRTHKFGGGPCVRFRVEEGSTPDLLTLNQAHGPTRPLHQVACQDRSSAARLESLQIPCAGEVRGPVWSHHAGA